MQGSVNKETTAAVAADAGGSCHVQKGKVSAPLDSGLCEWATAKAAANSKTTAGVVTIHRHRLVVISADCAAPASHRCCLPPGVFAALLASIPAAAAMLAALYLVLLQLLLRMPAVHQPVRPAAVLLLLSRVVELGASCLLTVSTPPQAAAAHDLEAGGPA